jgi:hypothetical protein
VRANNNAVYEKLFLVEFSSAAGDEEQGVLLSEALGDCPLVMDAPPRHVSMSRTTAADLESCNDPFDVKPFLLLQAHDSSAHTDCELAANQPGAFPIRYNSEHILV